MLFSSPHNPMEEIMKKILTIFLGGTICCSVKNIDGEKVRDIDTENAKSVLINNFTKENPTYGNLGEELFHVSDLGMSILSENMNVEHLYKTQLSLLRKTLEIMQKGN